MISEKAKSLIEVVRVADSIYRNEDGTYYSVKLTDCPTKAEFSLYRNFFWWSCNAMDDSQSNIRAVLKEVRRRYKEFELESEAKKLASEDRQRQRTFNEVVQMAEKKAKRGEGQ